jgi:hypothetical protein
LPPLFFDFSLPLVYIIAPLCPVVKYFFEKLQNKKTGQKPCFFAFLLFGYKLGKLTLPTAKAGGFSVR